MPAHATVRSKPPVTARQVVVLVALWVSAPGWARPLASQALAQSLPAPAPEGRRLASTEHLDISYPARWAPWIEDRLEALDRRYRILARAVDAELPVRPQVRLWPGDADEAGIDPASRRVEGLLLPRLEPRQRLDLRLDVADLPDEAAFRALEADLSLLLAAQLIAEAGQAAVPAAFALGFARYLQPIGEDQTRLVAALKAGGGAPPAWAELLEPGAEYRDPLQFQAWSLSVVHGLLHEEGLAAFGDLLRAFRQASGWRDALQETYNRDPATLEAQWRARLPAYVDGAWREHLFYGTDLDLARERLAQADFRGAATLARAVAQAWDTGAEAQTQEALALAERAEAANVARSDLTLGVGLLHDGHYAAAAAAAAAALDPLRAVGDEAGADLAGEVLDRAGRGQAAIERWTRARTMEPWRSLQAGLAARQAARDLYRLGHGLRAREVDAWARERLAPVAVLGAVLAVLGLLALLRWLWNGTRTDGLRAGA